MSEWWTYRLEDFLMFSPRTYWRLIEQYNRDLWPAHVVAIAAGLGCIWLAARRAPGAAVAVPAVLALGWSWVGWGFHWQRYATINWAASWLAAAFLVQALLLLAAAAIASTRDGGPAVRPASRATGLLLATGGVVLFPLTAPLAGRPWAQAEAFGLVPEPTVLATLGLLLAIPAAHRRWLMVIPVLAMLVGGATMWLLAN